MSKLRVAVYAISKNESAFVSRWVQSMSEADHIYVLDTGSTDDTVERLTALGVTVLQEKVDPWRFDSARNRSLEMVPQDVDLCVCTDLDEVFHPGWRAAMESAWSGGAHRLSYRYTWSFRPDGGEGCVFWISKAHARHGFRWIHPVHEVLQYSGSAQCIEKKAAGVQLDHHPDATKSRGQYLPLLELAVKEEPDDDRNMHYLGREYLFHGMWERCRETLQHHLTMPSATWPDERCASMRFLARASRQLGLAEEEEQWLLRAVAEAPWLREPWLEASALAARQQDWIGSLCCARKALAIKNRSQTYINEADSWGAKPWDLAAVAAYYAGLFDLALEYGKQAAALDPGDERLQANLAFYREKAAPSQGTD